MCKVCVCIHIGIYMVVAVLWWYYIYVYVYYSRDSSSLAHSLQEIQLADIKMVVKLMCLCVSGDISPENSKDHHTLSYLATAIATLAHSNASASKLLLNVCSRELFLASFGFQAGIMLPLATPSTVSSQLVSESNCSPNFAVIQSLVGLMIQADAATLCQTRNCMCNMFIHIGYV